MIRTVILLTSFLFAACSATKSGTSTSRPVETEAYFDHTVRYQGETLGAISNWYIGSAGSWPKVARLNPNLNVKNLRKGDVIKIPLALAKRRDTFPQDYIQVKGLESEKPASASMDPETLTTHDVAVTEVTQDAASPRSPSPDDELFTATAIGDRAQVNAALAKGADENYVYNDRSILGWAAQSGNTAIVEALIAAGADVDVVDGVGHTPLMRAVETRQRTNAEALLKANASLERKTSRGETALHLAIRNGDAELLRTLIRAGADVNLKNVDGTSPMLLATQNDGAEIIRILGEAKSDIEAGNAAYSPLSYAVDHDRPAQVAALLQSGASPNSVAPSGAAPIFQAIDKPEVLRLLIDARADLNAVNSYSETPLLLAVRNSFLPAVQALVEGGADVNVRSANGLTPLGAAYGQGSVEIAEYLKSKGATE